MMEKSQLSINRHGRQLCTMTRESDGGSTQAMLKVKIVHMMIRSYLCMIGWEIVTIWLNQIPPSIIWFTGSLSGQYKQILIGERVDIHLFNMFIRFKSEHLYVMVVYEGVHEEVYLGSVIRLSKMGNFTLVVQVMHKSYCSHKKWAQKSTDLHGLNASTTQRSTTQRRQN